jgi:hypothetical protein
MGTTQLPWALSWIVDDLNRDTGFAMLNASIDPDDREVFDELAAGHRIIGSASYGHFPLFHEAYGGKRGDDPREGWKRPEVLACEAWAHCFRDPDQYLPPGKPRMLVSTSDFVEICRVWKVGRRESPPAKRWDLIYTCLPDWFNAMTKNWELAKSCAVRLAEAGARVLLVGCFAIPDAPRHPNIETRPQLRWSEMLQATAQSRIAFFPNCMDASPRALTEAIALDVPVLVNRQILGGWKYVEPETGRFFDDDDDVVSAFFDCLASSFQPRQWLLDHGYGQDGAARRLAAELQALVGPSEKQLNYALPTSQPPDAT